MTQTPIDLPVRMLACYAAVAVFAAMGLVSMLPVPTGSGATTFGVALLTPLVAAGLVLGGQRTVTDARNGALRNATQNQDTGLATPFAAERMLATEFAAAQRGRPLTVVLIRLEQYPRYVAKHGRPVGKQLQRLAGRSLAKSRRGMHLTAHHGRDGVTFLSILSSMDVNGASVYAKRVRRDLLTLPGVPQAPGVSIGIVPYDMSMREPSELVEQAERALRKGSESGGRIVVVGQTPGVASA